jgi:hypothetical protein
VRRCRVYGGPRVELSVQLFGRGIHMFPLSSTVAGFLELVELWKGLVVLPYIASSIEVYGIHDPVEGGYHGLWVKMCNLCRV